MTRSRQRQPGKGPQRVFQPADRTAAAYLAFLSVAVVVCFFPLLTYFFAQDDFILMHTAVRDGWGAVTDFFAATPGHFRPLTKAVYFGVMYRVFGLNAAPFHVVSILVHLVNVLLLFALLRRFRVTTTAALITTTLFALSVAYFHVIAWISCIQQLLGLSFLLASLIWGVDYLRTGSERRMWASIAVYILALCSVEQSFGVPVILLSYSVLLGEGNSSWSRLRKASGQLVAHGALMLTYLLFIGVWKTAPSDGFYAFSFGANVPVNLATYLGWMLHFEVALPSHMAVGRVAWQLSHVLLALLVLYQLVRRRGRETLFALVFFISTIFPTLFLSNHTFYLHTYIPAFGILYLIALLTEDVLALRPLRGGIARIGVLIAVLVGVTAMSSVMVRRNEQYPFFTQGQGAAPFSRSFVLRRAKIARAMYDCLASHKPFGSHVEKVYMVYGREEGRNAAKWNKDNVVAALGNGSLINLIYEKPDMPVTFKIFGDAVHRSEERVSDIYYFDDVGDCQKFTEE
jgi:hypothetical protein